jgi:hypothetical protein
MLDRGKYSYERKLGSPTHTPFLSFSHFLRRAMRHMLADAGGERGKKTELETKNAFMVSNKIEVI